MEVADTTLMEVRAIRVWAMVHEFNSPWLVASHLQREQQSGGHGAQSALGRVSPTAEGLRQEGGGGEEGGGD